MKKKILFIITAIFFGMISVNAVSGNYYYSIGNNKYHICTDDNCMEVVKGQNGFVWNLAKYEIKYQDTVYKYSVTAEKEYSNKTLNEGKYFYKNSDNSYVLCESNASCKTYTFDELTNMGAIIGDKSIFFEKALGPGEVEITTYSYKEVQSENSNNSTSNTPAPTTDYCVRLKEPLKFLGHIVLILKILIPVFIIAFGMLDFFKAIIGSKDDDVKKSIKSLIMRVLSGVVIFFIPTIVSVIFSMIGDFANIQGDFDACQKCIFRVSKCE